MDVVAQKDKCIYFVEVKSRSSLAHGSGLDYITPKKLHSMKRAAESWVAIHDYTGEYCLSAVAVDADHEPVFIETIT